MALPLSQLVAPGWRWWTPEMEVPLPRPPHVSGLQHKCTWRQMAYNSSYSMCVREGEDKISRTIMSRGAFEGCSRLPSIWASSASTKPARSDIFLELGGNIGACTLEMLVKTNARVIVLEPSPANLYYLMSTLHAAHAAGTLARGRVLVLPYAASDKNGTSTLYAAKNNAGNSVIGVQVKDYKTQDMTSERYRVHVVPLDTLFPSLDVRLAKIDVQGFECRAIRGMRSLVNSGSVGTIKVELAARWLTRQGCAVDTIWDLIEGAGFLVDDRCAAIDACRPYCDLPPRRAL